jgi:hypothetical protein
MILFYKKIFIIILLGLFLIPSFSYAQEVGPTDIQSVEDLTKAYTNLLVSGKDKNDPEVVAAKQAAMDECNVLSGKISASTAKPDGRISSGSIVAQWIPGPPEGCNFRFVNSLFPDGSINNTRPNPELWNEIKNGKVFTMESADERRTRASRTVEDDIGPVSFAINLILTSVFNVITSVLLGLASLAGYILSVVTDSVTTANTPDMVTVGWRIMRDILNMFFILALIVISLATILRIESYNYKKLLARLVIMALLINFSKVIAESLIDISNFLTQIFASSWDLKSIGQLYSGIITEGRGITGFFSSGGGADEALAKGILKVVAALIITVSFLALAGLFFIRMIGLWILTILSPVAFALNILPVTQQYAKQWWTTFIKYLIWAPVAMVFLYIGQLFYIEKGSSASITNNDTFDALFISAFFWAAILVAKQAGMVGSDMVINGAKSIGKLPAKGLALGGRAAANFGLEKIIEKGGPDLRPSKILEGWRESRAINTLRREAAGAAIALERGSAISTPTTFFQRYLGKGSLKRLMGGGNKRGRELIAETDAEKEEINQKAKDAKEFSEKEFKANRLTEEQYNNDLDRIENRRIAALKPIYAREEKARELLAPQDYFTQKKLRMAQNEELKNIHTDNWHELVELFQGALREGNQARAAAIHLKLADTYNENELHNSMRYTRDMSAQESADGKAHKVGEFFVQSPQGADNFRKLIYEEQLGLKEQASMMIMNDVSDKAEERGHYGIMRMYGAANGKLRLKGKGERDDEQIAENGKLNSQRLWRDGNRLIFFDEKPDGDYDITGNRRSVISDAGLQILRQNFAGAANFLDRDEFNASLAKAVATKENAKTVLGYARNIDDEGDKKRYLEVMSAMIDYGRPKLSKAEHDMYNLEDLADYQPKAGRAPLRTRDADKEARDRTTTRGSAKPLPGGVTSKEQAVEQVIKETSVSQEKHDRVREVVREVNSGGIDTTEALRQLKDLGSSADAANKAINSMKNSLADTKVKDIPAPVVSSAGIDTGQIERAVRKGILDGLSQGNKLGTSNMGQVIKRQIVSEHSGVTDIDNIADQIVREVNKPETN